MGSKTKIVVLHMKEIVYTVIFLVLALILIVVLTIMFRSKSNDDTANSKHYTPGIYTSTLTLNNHALEVEVTVDETHINAIRFSNLDESIAAAYPLIQPALEEIADQIYQTQNPEQISYSSETPYTSQVIAETIKQALEKAATD